MLAGRNESAESFAFGDKAGYFSGWLLADDENFDSELFFALNLALNYIEYYFLD